MQAPEINMVARDVAADSRRLFSLDNDPSGYATVRKLLENGTPIPRGPDGPTIRSETIDFRQSARNALCGGKFPIAEEEAKKLITDYGGKDLYGYLEPVQLYTLLFREFPDVPNAGISWEFTIFHEDAKNLQHKYPPGFTRRDPPQNSALHVAVIVSRQPILEQFIRKLGVGIPGYFGDTPAAWAVLTLQIEKLRMLIAAGAPMNNISEFNFTLLHWAAARYSHANRDEKRKLNDIVDLIVEWNMRCGSDAPEVRKHPPKVDLIAPCNIRDLRPKDIAPGLFNRSGLSGRSIVL